jgi:hypothetical protein
MRSTGIIRAATPSHKGSGCAPGPQPVGRAADEPPAAAPQEHLPDAVPERLPQHRGQLVGGEGVAQVVVGVGAAVRAPAASSSVAGPAKQRPLVRSHDSPLRPRPLPR